MGYGARALKCLESYYRGEEIDIDEAPRLEQFQTFEEAAAVDKVCLSLHHPL